MTLRRIFLEHSENQPSPALRYGFLVLICALFSYGFYLLVTTPPSYHGNRYAPVVTSFALLLNHLAFNFRPRPSVTLVLRILSLTWLTGCLLYVFWLQKSF